MLLSDIIDFIKNPRYIEKYLDISPVLKLSNIFLMLCWIYGITIITFVPISIAFGSNTKNLIDSFISNDSVPVIILYVVILAPLIEELTFRLPLKVSKLALPISTFILTYVFIGSFLTLSGGKYHLGFIYFIACVLLSSLIGFFTVREKSKVENLYIKYFRWIIYLSIFAFGFIHLTNYTSFNGVPGVLIPVFVLPQLITGVVITYVRVNYGFFYGYLTHMSYNLILTLVSIIDLAYFKSAMEVLFLVLCVYGLITLFFQIIMLSLFRNKRI